MLNVRKLHQALIDTHGSLLTPATPGKIHVCTYCRGAVTSGYRLCHPCSQLPKNNRIHRGFITYATKRTEYYRCLTVYKHPHARGRYTYARQIIGPIIYVALHAHLTCAEKLAGQTITAYTVVPSLRPGVRSHATQHPLTPLVVTATDGLPGIHQLDMLGQPTPQEEARDPNPGHYALADPSAAKEKHVLLIEDTRVSGGHSEAAAQKLLREGASCVSLLTIARLVDPDKFTPAKDLADHVAAQAGHHDLIATCPWTIDGKCP